MRRLLELFFTLALVACSLAYAQTKYKLAITTVFQNEGRFLREWLEYHKLVGVEHFYLYNNLSNDNYREVLQPYIDCGDVTLIDWPYGSNSESGHSKWGVHRHLRIQTRAYRDATRRADCEWLAIIDADEFLVPATGDTLITLLEKYRARSEVGGLLLPWVMFGTSGVDRLSEGCLMIEELQLHWPTEKDYYQAWAHHEILKTERILHHKSIVRPGCVQKVRNVHAATLLEGKVFRYIPLEEAQINHYWTRDEAFLREVKIPRRERWGYDADWSLSRAAVYVNRSILGERILRFVPQLREARGFEKEGTCVGG